MNRLLKKAILILVIVFLVFSTQAKSEEVVPETEQKTHTIVKGDTLWDLSENFFNNPFVWPKLWARNPYIKNPHLIYPDDELNIAPSEQKLRVVEKIIEKEVGEEVKPVQKKAAKKKKTVARVIKKVVPKKEEPIRKQIAKKTSISQIADSKVLATAGYFTYSYPKEIAKILGDANSRILLDNGSSIFIDEGEDKGIKKGEMFTVVSVSDPLVDKAGNTGYVVKILGDIKVTQVLAKNQSKAVILNCYDSIQKGNLIVPLFRIKKGAMVSKAVTAVEGTHIVATKDSVIAIASENIIYLNKGTDSGISAGNRFSIYRGIDTVSPARFEPTDPSLAKPTWGFDGYVTYPPRVQTASAFSPEEKLGIITVIYTTKDTATAIVNYAAKEIKISDEIK